MEYAEQGIPVFPCKPGGKTPVIPKCPDSENLTGEALARHASNCGRDGHGFHDATTDPRRISAWFDRWPQANIAVPTGERSGILVVDHDSYKETAVALGEVEAALGPVSESGVTIETGSGGRQYAFRYPAGSGIRNHVNLLPGVDVRGEGGYVVAPPSVTRGPYRRLDDRPLADPPAHFVEALARPQVNAVAGARGIATAPSAATEVEAIPQGSRDDRLTRIAGRLHDGTRNLEDLTVELLEVNARRCDPPLPSAQVAKIARSIHGREPCRAGRPREVEELVGALSDFWQGESWKGLAGKSEARFARALIREGRLVGSAIPTGLRVEKSFRQMAEILGVHRNTINNLVRRAKASSWLRQDNANRRGEESGAFVLVDPRRFCDTTPHAAAVGGGVTSLSRSTEKLRNVADLATLHYRHRGPVGYSREHTLCVIEARGPLSREAVAEIVDWKSPSDLERLHLQPLVELGLLDCRGGLYALSSYHAERGLEARRRPYSTLQMRRVRRRSAEGRVVTTVEENGKVASEEDRYAFDRDRHEREREAWRNHLDNGADNHYANVGADGWVEDLRPVEDERIGQDAPSLSLLARAIRDYLDKNPSDVRRSPYWIAATLWSYDLFDGKPTAQETSAALEELGRAGYLEEIIGLARGAA